MSDELQPFTFPDDEPEAARQPAPPVVVVQYRRGWIAMLSTPLLIVVAAGAVLSHRIKIQDWRGLPEYLGQTVSPQRAEPVVPAARTLPVPLAVPSTMRVRGATTSRASRPPVPPRPGLARPVPLAMAPGPIRSKDLQAEATQAWEDIRREAARTQDHLAEMEAAKARESAEVEQLVPPTPPEFVHLGRANSQEDRVAFLDDLRRALASPPGQVGAALKEVCDRNGVAIGGGGRGYGTSSGVELTYSGRRDRIVRSRNRGEPEAMILEDLIRVESMNRIARSGAKTQHEVLVRASRQLLSVPLRRAPSDLLAR